MQFSLAGKFARPGTNGLKLQKVNRGSVNVTFPLRLRQYSRGHICRAGEEANADTISLQQEVAAAVDSGADAEQQQLQMMQRPAAAERANQQQQQQDGVADATAVAQAVVTDGEETVEEYELVQMQAPPPSFDWRSSKYVQGAGVAAAAVLVGTFALAMYRTYQKYTSTRAQRKRQVDKNKALVEALNKYLPNAREQLTAGAAKKLPGGFTPVEVFRKYLWYLLRERPFNQDAVDDLVHLKKVLSLDDADVAEALKERSQRIYDKYGTLMLNTEGFTAEGLERKATCTALFKKMLYLTECEQMLDQEGDAVKTVDLRRVFGATDDDIAKVRIVSLYELDLDKLDRMASTPDVKVIRQEEQKGGQAP